MCVSEGTQKLQIRHKTLRPKFGGYRKIFWVTLKSHDSSTCILNPDDSDDSRLSPVPEAGIKAVQLRKNTEVKRVRKQLCGWV